MERSSRSRRSRWLALLALILIPGLARRVTAQAATSTLTVRLRSPVGNGPVPQVAVQVVDAASDAPLAQGTTATTGQVQFAHLPSMDVRVRLDGRLPDGTVLRRTPQDTD